MSALMRWRILVALLLGVGALTFTAGTIFERSSHHEDAAHGAAEHGIPSAPLPVDPTAAPLDVPVPTTPLPSPAGSPAIADLAAPEGSEAREAAERAESANSPDPTPLTTATPSTQPTTGAVAGAPVLEVPEGDPAREAAEQGAGAHSETDELAESAEAGERLFGINTESWTVVALADVASLALLLLVLFTPAGVPLRAVAVVTAAFATAAAVLDVREAVHQHDLGATGLTTTAAVVAAVHLSCALAAVLLAAGRGPGNTLEGTAESTMAR